MKQTRILFTVLLICQCLYSLAGGIKGLVKNQKGEPLVYVTIYCKELQKGCNSNADGLYELSLIPGTYSIIYQSIDYKRQEITVTVGTDWQTRDLILEEQTYALRELTVSLNKEEQATRIMKKVVGMAPYYRRQLLRYQARVYIKGTGRLDEAPRLLNSTLKESKIEKGKTYVTESVTALEFIQPRTYREKVISLKTNMPFENAPEPMRMARGSEYDATATQDHVSPLSAQAFGVYRFELEGSFYENGYEVNKIKVIPKRKGSDLVEGYLYIIEGLWCLHGSALQQSESGFDYLVKTTYKPLSQYPFVWVPVTYDIAASADILGVKGSFRYLAGISDYKVVLNPNLDHTAAEKASAKAREQEAPVPPPPPKSKNQLEIEALLAKDKLSRRETLKLASKMKAESEKSENKQFQVLDSSYLLVDSQAMYRDSAYWAEIRPVPLRQDEVTGYAVKPVSDTLKRSNKAGYHFSVSDIIWGGDSISFHQKKYYFAYDGIVESLTLNAVEGVALQNNFRIGASSRYGWRYTQWLKAPLERPRWQFSSELLYRFDHDYYTYVSVKGGSVIKDFNLRGIAPLTDAFQLLFYDTNYSRWYQQDFIQFKAGKEIITGLQGGFSVIGSNRYSIENLNRYAGKKGIADNNPGIAVYTGSQKSLQWNLGFVYQPHQRYSVLKGRKVYLPNTYPRFQLNAKGVYWTDGKLFQAEIGMEQSRANKHWISIHYQFKAGMSLSSGTTHFADYQHFLSNQSWLYNGGVKFRFEQLPYYTFSTLEGYGSGGIIFDFKRLLLRRLPYFNLLSFRENVYVQMLKTAEQPLYTEIGYRLSELPVELYPGINISFLDGKYQSILVYLAFRF